MATPQQTSRKTPAQLRAEIAHYVQVGAATKSPDRIRRAKSAIRTRERLLTEELQRLARTTQTRKASDRTRKRPATPLLARVTGSSPVPSATQRPIVLHEHFTLSATGLTVTGQPTFAQYEDVGTFIKRAHQASGFWLADWLRFGESRTEWAERLSQVQDATGLSVKTLANIRAVGAIEKSRRRDGVAFAVHAEVAGLAPADQSRWLERAETEGWDRREIRHAIRAAKRKAASVDTDDRSVSTHTVEVGVLVDVEADSAFNAEQSAWNLIALALQGGNTQTGSIPHARVIAAHAKPQ